MIACYDLEACPETYDIVGFISIALAQANRDEDALEEFLIIPGLGTGGFRSDGAPYHAAEQQWRLKELLVPLISTLLPKAELHIFRSRESARAFLTESRSALFPPHYDIDRPTGLFSVGELINRHRSGYALPKFASHEYALEAVERKQASKTPQDSKGWISITLRLTHSFSPRNSSVDEWKTVCSALLNRGYGVFIVPDTETTTETTSGWGEAIYCAEAAYNVALRQAIYQASDLNLFVNNGPAILCYFSDFDYITFGLAKGATCVSSLDYFAKEGFLPGAQWPGSSERQLMVWEDDRADIILLACEEWERTRAGEKTSMQDWRDKAMEALTGFDHQSALGLSAVALTFNRFSHEAFALRIVVLIASQRPLEAYLSLLQARTVGLSPVQVGETLSCHEYGLGAADLSRLAAAARLIESKPDSIPNKEFWCGLFPIVAKGSDRWLGQATVVIYGTGSLGRATADYLSHRCDVFAFCDSDPQKWGNLINGRAVISPMKAVAIENAIIVVASIYRMEILANLLSCGAPIDRIAIALEDRPEEIPV